MTDTKEKYKYYAFISYNSKDTKWGKTIQRKLEGYRLPAKLCAQHGWERNPIKPVFFAPTDIQPGGLTVELQERLRASRHLIVICSPNSAKSEWVGKEIEYFHSLGRTKNIHFFIVDGEPHSGNPKTECFNPIIDKLGIPEILGANIHEKNVSSWPWIRKERAYVQLITKLLGIEFDAIWQRHKRQMAELFGMWVLGIGVIISIFLLEWYSSQPVDIQVKLNEASYINNELPPLKDAVVTISLDNETKTDTIKSITHGTMFKNIPAKFIGQEVRFTVKCNDFHDTDTTLVLSELNTIEIHRNAEVYGNIHFRLWDVKNECPLANTAISIDGTEAVSDEEGNVSLFMPIEKQKKHYTITTPLSNDIYTIYMPCGDYNAILIE